MKAIESFDVMESFGMKDLSVEEILDVDGGFCFCQYKQCEYTQNGGESGSDTINVGIK